jgi:uncharacterized protein (UPF0276 family)
MPARSDLGIGIGLRPPHYQRVIEERPPVDWLEVISENFMVAGGNPRRVLRAVRERYPIVLHGVSLSVGSTDPLDEAYLAALAALIDEVEPAWVSDHLCWSSFGGHRAHDLWPLPLTEEALLHVSLRVDAIQERLDRRILLENVSTYARFAASHVPEWEFLAELVRRTGCGLLLDVNNVFVSARNLGFAPEQYIDSVPAEAVEQVHLAGHRDQGTHLVDTHDRPVCHEVWGLYARLCARAGAVPTSIEWDDEVPPLETLLAEAEHARRERARYAPLAEPSRHV